MTANKINALNETLSRWITRFRIQRAFRTSVYGILAGLGMASVVSAFTYFTQSLLQEEFELVFAFTITAAAISGTILGLVWPVARLESARRFDRIFGLKERVSTALELHQKTNTNRLSPGQLEDALTAASQVDYRAKLPLRIPVRALFLALILFSANAAFWINSETLFTRAQQKRQIQTTIDHQAQEIEALIEEIAANPDLTDVQKTDLIEPLQEALEALNDAKTLEDAYSAIEEARDKLRALENPGAQDLANGLKEAGEALAEEVSPAMQPAAENLASGEFGKAADNLREIDVSNLSQAELDKIAEDLETIADSVASSNPDLSSALQQAANAVREGNPQAAQEGLEQAAETLENLEQQLAASEAAQQAGNQLDQNQAAILDAGQQGQNGQSPGNSGANGSEAGGQSNTNSGSGSGEGSGNSNPTGSEAGNTPISQGNSPDGTGESVFQPISPSSIGGEGSDWIAVPPGGVEGENVVGTGPVDEGSAAPVTVPYTEVFPQYRNAANQAIDSGSIPAQYRDLIRDYFSSLEP